MSDIEIVVATTEEKNGMRDAKLLTFNRKGKPFFIDVYSNNYNVLVAGKSGSGKTFNMSMYIKDIKE